MKRIAVALLLVIVTSATHAAMPEIAPPRNGDDWTNGPNSACAGVAGKERASSGLGKVTGFELVSGLEKFYSDAANAVIPVGTAIRIYLLRTGGADQATIQELIETARVLGAEAGKRAQ